MSSRGFLKPLNMFSNGPSPLAAGAGSVGVNNADCCSFSENKFSPSCRSEEVITEKQTSAPLKPVVGPVNFSIRPDFWC